MPRLKTLQPKLRVLGSIVEERYGVAPTPRYRAKRTGRDADPRRTIPLNSHAWRKLRDAVLASEPLCRHCQERGIVEPATDVDHVSGDPSDNSMANLQPLCHSCHSIKTAADHGKRVASGCDADGLTGEWKKSLGADARRPPGTPSFTPKSEV